tara:strand:- start:65 stop:397 length:333 start_codon:yes stop_codon:yes gene_type:complete
MPKRKKTGRPKGAKNKDVLIVDTEATSCPTCGSSNRAAYWGKMRRDLSGTTPDGRIFEAITYRRTRCGDCGQHRVDREFSFAPNKTSNGKKTRSANKRTETAHRQPADIS